MKKSAIQFALYLHMHPEAGLEQWQLMRALPHGMLDLLQTAASGQKRSEIADSLGMSEPELRLALIKFLQLVISDNHKSPYRGLAAREQASLDTCTKHKKLLQNIFHPDKFQSEKAHEIIQQIQNAYNQIATLSTTNSHATTTRQATPSFCEEELNAEPVINFQVNHAPKPRSIYKRHEQKRQTNYVLMAGVAGLALVGLLVVLIVPSNPREVVRQPVIAEAPNTPDKKIILAGSIDTAATKNSPLTRQYQHTGLPDNSRIQILLNEFERGLEGNLINEFLESTPSSQSSRQIMNLFISADDKKVFLHGFSWTPTQNGYYGEGEFLARFQFSENNQWVTRKGKSSITLSDTHSKLLIERFHFEDNLH